MLTQLALSDLDVGAGDFDELALVVSWLLLDCFAILLSFSFFGQRLTRVFTAAYV